MSQKLSGSRQPGARWAIGVRGKRHRRHDKVLADALDDGQHLNPTTGQHLHPKAVGVDSGTWRLKPASAAAGSTPWRPGWTNGAWDLLTLAVSDYLLRRKLAFAVCVPLGASLSGDAPRDNDEAQPKGPPPGDNPPKHDEGEESENDARGDQPTHPRQGRGIAYDLS
jgi:hypothetical protein